MTKLETTLICVIAFILLAGGFAFYFEHRGAAACVAADTAAVTKQEAANEVQEAKATIEITQEDKTYHAALAAPTMPAPAIECVRAPSHRPVLQTAPTPSRPDAPTDLSKADSGGFDPTPKLTPIGRDADARVIALQSYITQECRVR